MLLEIVKWLPYEDQWQWGHVCKDLALHWIRAVTTIPETVLNKLRDDRGVQFPSVTAIDYRFSDRDELYNWTLNHLPNLDTITLTKPSYKLLTGLTSLSKLNTLRLNCNMVGDVVPNILCRLSKLTTLRLYKRMAFSDVEIGQLCYLTSLYIPSNKIITDACLTQLTNLTSLDLSYNPKITDVGVRCLTELRRLLLRTNRHITDNGIRCLTKLQYLDLYDNNQITDAVFADISNITTLITAWSNSVTNDGFVYLTNLECLKIGCYTRITNNVLTYIPSLTELDVTSNASNAYFTDTGLKKLTNLMKLVLRHNSGPITMAGIRCLPNLHTLDLRGDYTITDAEIASLPKHILIRK